LNDGSDEKHNKQHNGEDEGLRDLRKRVASALDKHAEVISSMQSESAKAVRALATSIESVSGTVAAVSGRSG
jgi:hypothetical protein